MLLPLFYFIILSINDKEFNSLYNEISNNICLKQEEEEKEHSYQDLVDLIHKHFHEISWLSSKHLIKNPFFLVACIEAFLKRETLDFQEKEHLSDWILLDLDEDKWQSKVYDLNNDKYLFVWQNGRGNHNHGFWLWIISIQDGKFSAYPIKNNENKYDFTARQIDFESQESLIKIVINNNEKIEIHYLKPQF